MPNGEEGAQTWGFIVKHRVSVQQVRDSFQPPVCLFHLEVVDFFRVLSHIFHEQCMLLTATPSLWKAVSWGGNCRDIVLGMENAFLQEEGDSEGHPTGSLWAEIICCTCCRGQRQSRCHLLLHKPWSSVTTSRYLSIPPSVTRTSVSKVDFLPPWIIIARLSFPAIAGIRDFILSHVSSFRTSWLFEMLCILTLACGQIEMGSSSEINYNTDLYLISRK